MTNETTHWVLRPVLILLYLAALALIWTLCVAAWSAFEFTVRWWFDET